MCLCVHMCKFRYAQETHRQLQQNTIVRKSVCVIFPELGKEKNYINEILSNQRGKKAHIFLNIYRNPLDIYQCLLEIQIDKLKLKVSVGPCQKPM